MLKNISRLATMTYLYPIVFTLFFLILLMQYNFSTMESFLYDLRAKLDFNVKYSNNIVVVTLDEESDEFLGESLPYTFATYNRLLDRILPEKPLIISFLSSYQNISEKNLFHYEKFIEKLKQFQENGGNIKIGVEKYRTFNYFLPKKIEDFGISEFQLSEDNFVFSKDDVVRRVAINFSGEDSLHLEIANTWRKLNGLVSLDSSSINGSYYSKEDDSIKTIFRYMTDPIERKGNIINIPFHRVIVGNYPPGTFENKVILIGSKYLSNIRDYVLTPFNSEDYITPRIFVDALQIDSLIQGKTISKLPRHLSMILCIALAFLLSFVISQANPIKGLIITVSTFFGASWRLAFTFSVFGLWLYSVHIMLTIFVIYYIWVPYRAIAEYQQRYAIQEETKLLKKVEGLKQNFISLMSHDLKTPVAKIAGIVDILKREHNVDDKLKKYHEMLADSTQELNRFITSILDLTKIESNNLKLQIISRDVNSIIETVVEDLKYEINEKQMNVSLELGPLYPINIDVILIKRVISNIVENSLKYAGIGKNISIKTWDDEQWTYIEISDNGVGIKNEDLEHIFERFYRVKNDANYEIKGSGLGLYLVRYFIRLHGGDIAVKSEIEKGTSFLINLKNT